MPKYLSDRYYLGFALIVIGVGLILTPMWIGESGPGWTDYFDVITGQGWYFGHLITAIAIAAVIGGVAYLAIVAGLQIVLSRKRRD